MSDTNWRSLGDLPLAVYRAEFARRGSPMLAEVDAIYAAVKGYSLLYLAQVGMESEYANTGFAAASPEAHNALGTKVRGQNRYQRFASWAAGAKEWRARILDPDYAYADTVTLADYIHVYAPDKDGNDEAAYVAFVEDYRSRFAAAITTITTGDTTVATYTTTIPGLPGGPLKTLAPVRIKLIPEWRTLNRPGIKAEKPRRSVQHGNGNPNSTAAGEANYLYNGAEGRQASYHSSIDDKEIWIMVPADEVTWQAADGSGPGNMCGYSCEMVEDAALWADPARRAAVIRNTADFMGRVSARLEIAKPEQHKNFNYILPPELQHDCPNKLRYVWIGGRLAWDIYVEYWQAAKADELRLMAGDGTGGPVVPPPAPTYAKPVPIPELAGISIDQHDSVDGIVTRDGGDDFIFVADVVEAVRPTKRLQFASAGSPSVGPDLVTGERFVVTWLVKAADGQWYYVTPWWTRILRKDTKRIADAPIVPVETVAIAA